MTDAARELVRKVSCPTRSGTTVLRGVGFASGRAEGMLHGVVAKFEADADVAEQELVTVRLDLEDPVLIASNDHVAQARPATRAVAQDAKDRSHFEIRSAVCVTPRRPAGPGRPRFLCVRAIVCWALVGHASCFKE